MTEQLAIELAHSKMREQSIVDYIFRYRHLVLEPQAIRVMEAENETLILISPQDTIKVSSRAGLFDLTGLEITELQYVHSGKVSIENTSITNRAFVPLLQIIIKPINHGTPT